MESLVSNPTFQLYVAAAILLGFKLLLLANNTALSRASAGEAVNPEDRKLNKEATIVFEDGNAKTERYRRAHRNALENIPLFLITGLLLSLTQVPFVVAAALFGSFVAFRVLHSVAYVGQLQPWRTASFGLAALVQLGMLGCLGYYTFAA